MVQTQALNLHPIGTPRLSILRPGIVFSHTFIYLELQTTMFCSMSFWCVGFDNLKIVVNKQLWMSLVRNRGRRCNQKCQLRNRNCQPLCLEALGLCVRGVQMGMKVWKSSANNDVGPGKRSLWKRRFLAVRHQTKLRQFRDGVRSWSSWIWVAVIYLRPLQTPDRVWSF